GCHDYVANHGNCRRRGDLKAGRARVTIRGGDHEFQTKADGVHRSSGRVAAPARYCWSAIGVGCAEDREARTPDRAVAEAVRAAAEAAQGSSGRARPHAKENRESGGEGGSRAGTLCGPLACQCSGDQGPATAATAGKGESDAGGFLAAETVWRQHNMVNDVGTAFATTPYPFSPLYNEKEFHGSA